MLRLFRYLRNLRHSNNNNNQRNAIVAVITFDVNLPLQHGYLGNDLEPAPASLSTAIAIDGPQATVHELPCLACQLGVVVPGQILPVTLHHPADVSVLSALHNGVGASAGVGVVSATPAKCRYGTTLRILAYKEETDDSSGLTTIRAKLIGWQRFELLSVRREITGRLAVRVRLLDQPAEVPELALTTGARRLPLSPCPGVWQPSRPHRRLCQAACPMPGWVLDAWQPDCLAAEAAAELVSWCPTAAAAAAEAASARDTNGFSYWLMRQLPFPDSLRASLLACDHPCRRLVNCLDALRRCLGFACASCGRRLTGRSDLICLSKAGCTGAYVNPAGQVHDLVTLATVAKAAMRCRGWSSSEHSWFPGYDWRVASCRSCHKHIGWRFYRAVGRRQLQPAKFWGLCRSALTPVWSV